MKKLRVFVVSDSVGETGDQVAKAVISQFRPGLEKKRLFVVFHIFNLKNLYEKLYA